MRNQLFVHIPGTGGSWIWRHLASSALASGWAVCDLLRECHEYSGNSFGVREVVRSVRSTVGDSPILFRHRTSESVLPWLDDSAILATVVRDPVDRMVASVRHYGEYLRMADDLRQVEYHAHLWGVEFVRACRSGGATFEQLLEIAASQKFFRTYYTSFFASFFDLAERSPLLRKRLRERFAVVGHYESLSTATAEIATAFGLGEVADCRTFSAYDQEPHITPEQRATYVAALSADYELLDQLTPYTAAG